MVKLTIILLFVCQVTFGQFGILIGNFNQAEQDFYPTEDLLAYWPFDVNATDYANSYDLTVYNSPVLVEGHRNDCYDFGGNDSVDYMTVYHDYDLAVLNNPGTSSITICLWVKLDTKAYSQIIMLNGEVNTSGAANYVIIYRQPEDEFRFNGSNAAGINKNVFASTFGSPSIDTWYFICCYYDHVGDSMGISINNGTFDVLTSFGGHKTTGPATIGIANGGSAQTAGVYTDGKIDEIFIYGKVLEADSITALYNR